MKITLKKRLLDALNACRAIQSFVGERSFDDYEKSLMLRSAVERQFEILGEALHQAEKESAEVASLLPDARRIVGLRNRIIHGYDSVDDELLWQITHTHLPPLAERLEQLLDTGDSEPEA